MMEAYGLTVAALGVWALMLVVLSGLSLKGRTDNDLCACGAPKRDYANPVYRRHRAYQNALETSAPFLAATFGCIVAGAAAPLVNTVAAIFVLSRIAMAVVHIRTENQPLRSMTYGIGWVSVIVLAIAGIVAAF